MLAVANAVPEIIDQVEEVDIHVSPGLSKYYTPYCDEEFKPHIGQNFINVEMAIAFYRRYATMCGFDVRLGTTTRASDGTIIWKYMFCNREGEKNAVVSADGGTENSEKIKRRRVSTRFGCKALMAINFNSVAGYVVKRFEDQHTHPLCPEACRLFMKVNRNLNAGHKSFLLNCAKANIGPTRSYRLYKEAVGGYSNVGCTYVDFKNFARDLKAYVAGVDAQMLLDNLFRKRELSTGYYFEFDVDAKDQLNRLFWSDPICRRNYDAFGDSVSFDATYGTNRYNMIFVPFTGVNNHGKIVTFAAGLLSKEDVDSYSWVLKKFKDCMGRTPSMIITDQDPALKIAIERVLPETRHRLCMWHIMKKILNKVPAHLKNDSSFKKKLDAVVWSELIEPDEFERGWIDVMNEFGLHNHQWFTSMFDIREYWIPAYFRDFPLSGLLKTTSMSESVNSFFGRYLNRFSSLVEFFMQYDSALEAQRYSQDQLDGESTMSIPDLITPLAIERHALKIFSQKIFLQIQQEISNASFKCRVLSIDNDGICSTYKINDGVNGSFDVVYNMIDSTYVCSCKKFIRMGVLCCHIFVLFKDMNVDAFPPKYVINRWTKTALFSHIGDGSGGANKQVYSIEGSNSMMNRVYAEFYSCISRVNGNSEQMNSLLHALTQFKESTSTEIDEDNEYHPRGVTAKRRLFGEHFGSSVPNVVSVFPPIPVKTKGSGSRMKSSKELAMEKNKKPLRHCKKCNQKTNHDSRNCDKVSKAVTSEN